MTEQTEHLAHAERFWFQQVLTGRAAALPWPPADAGNNQPVALALLRGAAVTAGAIP